MRCIYTNVARDKDGDIINDATVTVYLAGSSTLASIYNSLTGATATNSVTTNSKGEFTFYVDRFDYDSDQKFKYSVVKTNYDTKTYDYIDIDRVVTGTYTISSDKTVTTHITVPKGVIYSVDSGKTLTFSGSLQAGPYQIFSGSGTVTGLDYYLPEWFGAKGDGATDDATAINACFTSAAVSASATIHPTVRFTSASGYGSASAITCPANINIIMDSPIIYTGTGNIALLTIGTAATKSYSTDYKIRVKHSTSSDWSSEDSIGVKFVNPYFCTINLVEARSFTIGMQLAGDGYGAVYNTITLGYLYGNLYGVDIHNFNSGWASENLWLGGSFYGNSGIDANRYGVRITSDGSTYNDNNLFIKPSFELQIPTGREGIPFVVEYGKKNEAMSMRLEGSNVTYVARISNDSQNNIFRVAHSTHYAVDDTSDDKTTFVENKGYEVNNRGRVIWESGPLHKKAYLYNATNYQIPGVHIATSSAATVSAYNIGLVIPAGGSYVQLSASRGVGVLVNTSTVKKFVVSVDTDDNYEPYVIVRAYDSAGAVLDSAGANHPYVSGPGFAYTNDWGKAYRYGIQNQTEKIFTVGDDVKQIAVIVGGVASSRLRSFSISAISSVLNQMTAVWSGYEECGFPLVAAIPTYRCDLVSVRKTVLAYAPASGSAEGWVCIRKAATTVSGNAAGGQTVISVASATGISNGDRVTIVLDDGTFHETTVNGIPAGNDVTITDALPSAASNGAGFYTAKWAAKGNLT